jgi:hypothetical protein
MDPLYIEAETCLFEMDTPLTGPRGFISFTAGIHHCSLSPGSYLGPNTATGSRCVWSAKAIPFRIDLRLDDHLTAGSANEKSRHQGTCTTGTFHCLAFPCCWLRVSSAKCERIFARPRGPREEDAPLVPSEHSEEGMSVT